MDRAVGEAEAKGSRDRDPDLLLALSNGLRQLWWADTPHPAQCQSQPQVQVLQPRSLKTLWPHSLAWDYFLGKCLFERHWCKPPPKRMVKEVKTHYFWQEGHQEAFWDADVLQFDLSDFRDV